MTENWGRLPGWRDYEISDWGNARSLNRVVDGKLDSNGMVSKRFIRGQRLTPRLRPDGTPCFNLWRGNDYVQIPARRLVLMTFVSPQPRGMDAINKDGDVTNNHLTNLEWGFKNTGASQLRRLTGMTR